MLFLLLTLLAPNSLPEQVFTMGSRALPRRYAACGLVCAFPERAESRGAGQGKPPPTVPVSPVSHVTLHHLITWARAKPREGRGPGQVHTAGS